MKRDPPSGSRKPEPPTTVERGHAAEVLAAEFLKTKGYRILRLNWRCREGEVDIIAEDGDVLVFVEVKLRGQVTHGRPAEAVNRRKQTRIVHAAALFAVSCKMEERNMRFDVVEILQDSPEGRPRFRLIRSAFTPPGRYSIL